MATRTWPYVMDEIVKLKKGDTQRHWQTAIKNKAFNNIHKLPVIETCLQHFLRVLESEKISATVYLWRIHNFALDMNWLAGPSLPSGNGPLSSMLRNAPLLLPNISIKTWLRCAGQHRKATLVTAGRFALLNSLYYAMISMRRFAPKICERIPGVLQTRKAYGRSLIFGRSWTGCYYNFKSVVIS